MAPRTSREGWNAELGRAADLGVEHIGIDAGECEGGIGYENSDIDIHPGQREHLKLSELDLFQ